MINKTKIKQGDPNKLNQNSAHTSLIENGIQKQG